MDRFNDLGKLVAGKAVCLLGSAQGSFTIPKHDFLASVNASHVSFGVSRIDIHFMNSFSQIDTLPIQRIVKEHVETVEAGFRVYLDAASQNKPVCLDGEPVISIPRSDRAAIYSWISGHSFSHKDGGDTVFSTGVFAALLLRKLGASVTLCGFSLDDGHALLSGSPRQHKDMDAKHLHTFTYIKARGM